MEASAQLDADRWPDRLVRACNADNERPDARCDDSRTGAALRDAPAWAREQADLALADLAAAGPAPIGELLSDAVAERFAVNDDPGTLNVLVARLLVPGGPWPGHFGLEAVVFTARGSRVPSWFPASAGRDHGLTLAETFAASAAFEGGHGSVIFPELLAVSAPPRTQGFGIVLVDRLAELYVRHVVPPARSLGWLSSDELGRTAELRELAFLAHEWGHRAVDRDYAKHAAGHRSRLRAVLSEVAADVVALEMLASSTHPDALRVARTLILDRILRDAWLPRADAQVAGLVGRHMVQFLARTGALIHTADAPTLDLPAAAPALGAEARRVRDVYDEGKGGDPAAVERFLADYGWAVSGNAIALARPDVMLDVLQARVEAPSAGSPLHRARPGPCAGAGRRS